MVEDEAGDAQLVEHELSKAGFHFVFKRVDSEHAFMQELNEFRPTVILSDHGLPTFDGFSALVNADSAMVQNEITYRRNMLNLLRKTGELLEERGITLQ